MRMFLSLIRGVLACAILAQSLSAGGRPLIKGSSPPSVSHFQKQALSLPPPAFHELNGRSEGQRIGGLWLRHGASLPPLLWGIDAPMREIVQIGVIVSVFVLLLKTIERAQAWGEIRFLTRRSPKNISRDRAFSAGKALVESVGLSRNLSYLAKHRPRVLPELLEGLEAELSRRSRGSDDTDAAFQYTQWVLGNKAALSSIGSSLPLLAQRILEHHASIQSLSDIADQLTGSHGENLFGRAEFGRKLTRWAYQMSDSEFADTIQKAEQSELHHFLLWPEHITEELQRNLQRHGAAEIDARPIAIVMIQQGPNWNGAGVDPAPVGRLMSQGFCVLPFEISSTEEMALTLRRVTGIGTDHFRPAERILLLAHASRTALTWNDSHFLTLNQEEELQNFGISEALAPGGHFLDMSCYAGSGWGVLRNRVKMWRRLFPQAKWVVGPKKSDLYAIDLHGDAYAQNRKLFVGTDRNSRTHPLWARLHTALQNHPAFKVLGWILLVYVGVGLIVWYPPLLYVGLALSVLTIASLRGSSELILIAGDLGSARQKMSSAGLFERLARGVKPIVAWLTPSVLYLIPVPTSLSRLVPARIRPLLAPLLLLWIMMSGLQFFGLWNFRSAYTSPSYPLHKLQVTPLVKALTPHLVPRLSVRPLPTSTSQKIPGTAWALIPEPYVYDSSVTDPKRPYVVFAHSPFVYSKSHLGRFPIAAKTFRDPEITTPISAVQQIRIRVKKSDPGWVSVDLLIGDKGASSYGYVGSAWLHGSAEEIVITREDIAGVPVRLNPDCLTGIYVDFSGGRQGDLNPQSLRVDVEAVVVETGKTGKKADTGPGAAVFVPRVLGASS